MKKILIISTFGFAAMFCLAAGIVNTVTLPPTTLAGTPAVLVTNDSAPVVVGYIAFRNNPNLVMNHNGIYTTNGLKFHGVLSLSTNTQYGVLATTNTFSTTNAAGVSVALGGQIPVYGWARTITSNNVVVWQSVNQIAP